jgi:hypothetical protein
MKQFAIFRTLQSRERKCDSDTYRTDSADLRNVNWMRMTFSFILVPRCIADRAARTRAPPVRRLRPPERSKAGTSDPFQS